VTDYVGTDATPAGVAVTERAGTSSSDTVAAGTTVLWRNTGAGTHVVTLTTNNTVDGLAVAEEPINLTAGQNKVSRVLTKWGDVNGRVQVAIDGTASEVKFSVLGGV
jgi:plastocyanin